MPRNRVIYANESVFVGPAPASGYHFISDVGVLGNAGDYNLVFPLHRVQSVDYSVTAKYYDVQVLGKNAIFTQPQIQPPEVNLNFEYIQFGVLNELRLGFYANYKIEYGPRSGESFYPDNFNVFSLSGFTATDMSQTENNELHWPLQYRDRRNLYLALQKEGNDLNLPQTYDNLHPNSANLTSIGFGNCYINNYTARASVGDFPRVTVSYVGENMKVYASGSGLAIPSLDSKSGLLVSDRIFNFPNFQSGSYAVSALLPGDINLDIYSSPALTGVNAVDGTGWSQGQYPQANLFENLGVQYSDLKIQSYELNLPLPRRDLRSIGYKYPLDRKPEYPLGFSFGLTCICGDSQTGDFTQFMRQNDDYDLSVKLNNPRSVYPRISGIGIRYDLKRAKLENISYSDRVGATWKTCSMKFRGAIDQTDFSRGLFISGQMGTLTNTLTTDLLLTEDSVPGTPSYLLQEDGVSRIVLRQSQAPEY